MKLYYTPLACSLATRTALEEIGRPAEYVAIDPTTRRAPDGRGIHPLGMVPVLHTDDGRVLTENAAILPYVTEGTLLEPRDDRQRFELRRWLSFVGTELHKAVFMPLLDKKAPEGAKRYALGLAAPRLAVVDVHLTDRAFLLGDTYSVADIYLVTVLNWAAATPVDLAPFAALLAFLDRVRARPAVARCLALELEAYLAAQGPAARPATARTVIDAFNDVFQRHDPSALDYLVADGCVVENTDGETHDGKEACIALWTQIARDPQIAFELEEVETSDDRATIHWTLRKNGDPALRGVNLMRVEQGRIVEARGYAKPIAPQRGAKSEGAAPRSAAANGLA